MSNSSELFSKMPMGEALVSVVTVANDPIEEVEAVALTSKAVPSEIPNLEMVRSLERAIATRKEVLERSDAAFNLNIPVPQSIEPVDGYLPLEVPVYVPVNLEASVSVSATELM